MDSKVKKVKGMQVLSAMLIATMLNTMNVANAQDTIASGTCGENLTWVLTSDSVLTISGSGAMADYKPGATPWLYSQDTIVFGFGDDGETSEHYFLYNSNITSVIIGDSVTNIGEWSFSRCRRLISVTMGNSITNIGKHAFADCRNLTSIAIGNSVKTIGERAFTGCGLTSITISNSVINIENFVFQDCNNLTSVTIPDNVINIANYAFCSCQNLTVINVGSKNTNYASDNGVLFNKSKTHLICYPMGKIGDYTVPNSVKSIGGYAFYGCRCSAIIIGDSVTSIGNYAFAFSGLKSITIGNGMKTIEKSAFFDCKILTSVTVHAVIPPLLHSWEFTDISTVSLLTVPVGSKPAYQAAIGWSNFKKITELGVAYVEQVTVSGTCGENLTWIFNKKDGVLTISGNGAIPDYVSTGSNPWCRYAITTVVIGDSVTSIGLWAFGYCTATSVIIGNSVTTIRDGAFMSCPNLTSVTIPKNITNIETNAFYYCHRLNTINVENDNTDYASENGVLFNKTKTTLIRYPEDKIDTSYVIPKSVTTIEDCAFAMCGNLMSVKIPKNVKIIGNYAFWACGRLTSIKIPNSVRTIGDHAFATCGFTSAKIPKSVKTIGKGLFDNLPIYLSL